MRTSASGNAFTISNSFFAGSVSDPPFATDASQRLRQADLEIRREQTHLVAVGLDQHVGENRNRVLAFDDALEELKFAQEVVLADDEFHVAMTSDWVLATASGAVLPEPEPEL
jgi:hypothetical protein